MKFWKKFHLKVVIAVMYFGNFCENLICHFILQFRVILHPLPVNVHEISPTAMWQFIVFSLIQACINTHWIFKNSSLLWFLHEDTVPCGRFCNIPHQNFFYCNTTLSRGLNYNILFKLVDTNSQLNFAICLPRNFTSQLSDNHVHLAFALN